MGRGGAAAVTWIFREDESRRRRGRHVDSPWRRGGAVAATWICRGESRDVDIPWRVVATPWLRRGRAMETGARFRYVDIVFKRPSTSAVFDSGAGAHAGRRMLRGDAATAERGATDAATAA